MDRVDSVWDMWNAKAPWGHQSKLETRVAEGRQRAKKEKKKWETERESLLEGKMWNALNIKLKVIIRKQKEEEVL